MTRFLWREILALSSTASVRTAASFIFLLVVVRSVSITASTATQRSYREVVVRAGQHGHLGAGQGQLAARHKTPFPLATFWQGIRTYVDVVVHIQTLSGRRRRVNAGTSDYPARITANSFPERFHDTVLQLGLLEALVELCMDRHLHLPARSARLVTQRSGTPFGADVPGGTSRQCYSGLVIGCTSAVYRINALAVPPWAREGRLPFFGIMPGLMSAS